ncbi:hypothetical protein ACKUFU_01445 (plasmid) [Escherichia coli]
MNISTETREILRNYKAVINARRREMGQKPLTTAQIVDEICDFVANQQAVLAWAVTIRSRYVTIHWLHGPIPGCSHFWSGLRTPVHLPRTPG